MAIKKKYNKVLKKSSLPKSKNKNSINDPILKEVEEVEVDLSLSEDIEADVVSAEVSEIQKVSFMENITTKINDFRGKANSDNKDHTKHVNNDYVSTNQYIKRELREEKSMNTLNTKQSQSLMNSDVVLKGDLETSSPLEICGKITGNIQSTSDVILIGDAYVEGNVSAKSLHLNCGTIIGDIVVSGVVIVEEKSKIKGTITAQSLKSTGTIEGNVTVVDNFSLTSTATVFGDVSSKSISIETGATLNGRYFTSASKSSVIEEHS